MKAQVRPERTAGWQAGLLALSLLSSAMAVAAPNHALKVADALGHTHRGWSKAAPDIDAFPVNPDGTVSVIVQFNKGEDHGVGLALAKRVKRHLNIVNAEALDIPVGLLEQLVRHPQIAYVTPNRRNTAKWDDAAPAVNAPSARQNYGVDGSGIGIAIIDSGVYQHDDLQTADMTGSRIVYSESFVTGDPSTDDPYGHGTHVAGIVAGNGHDSALGYIEQYLGIAPNANIINLRVLDANGAGDDSSVIAAIDRAVQLQGQYNIRVINLSLGRPVYESYTVDPLCQAVERAWQAGIVVVVAAGNMGRDNSFGEQGYGTIEAPGNDPNVITVGAMNEHRNWSRDDDVIASYSSKGPTMLDHIVKPDLVAPGNRITSLQVPGSVLATLVRPNALLNPLNGCGAADSDPTACGVSATGQYVQLSGTSKPTVPTAT